MSMEKNGNTLAPGDKVRVRVGGGSKVAGNTAGEVLTVDPEAGLVHVKFANYDQWIDFNDLERRG